ncbi:MAG: M1 family metallopeptidase [Flavobacteriales bacterium]|nr:M1 family metallopeptidase [Flavobacteriales bacterium]
MKNNISYHSLISFVIVLFLSVQVKAQEKNYDVNAFESIDELLPTANLYRSASGVPGPKYYQQKADYRIKVSLDEEKNQIHGEESVVYKNNSPDKLTYIWIQLDQNIRKKNSFSKKIKTSSIGDAMSLGTYENSYASPFDGGYKIQEVKDSKGRDLKYVINNTMMRIDLPKAISSGESFSFNIKWWYNINNYLSQRGRSGYEPFDDGNNLYVIAQWFPRMAVYNDREGWQTNQFVGAGEFALVFGDYDVKITVPADHIVGATGELQNTSSMLSSEQKKRLNKAKKNYDVPVIIHTQQEAEEAEKHRSDKTKTWHFKAKNVRDFAFSSSRKFIWDAMAVKLNDKTVMAMSYYPKEGNPLWEKYSTRAVAHTLRTYSKYTFDYPYSKAISVNAKDQGMEYPMICWNFGRPEEDGTYPKWVKYGMIGVIIHEVGHNYFPMIVNSDERKYAWMDEGLNSYLEFVTEQEWEKGFPSRKGHASNIVHFMKGDATNKATMMTRSDYATSYHANNYDKPATALNILRETVVGRELFDFAFKEYANRWKFKHPTPADFFRTIEDASGMDLGWFWRGWFYSNNNLDLELASVKEIKINNQNPNEQNEFVRNQEVFDNITDLHNKQAGIRTYIEKDTVALDFYNTYDEYAVTESDKNEYEYMQTQSDDGEQKAMKDNNYFYQLNIKNNGELIMPILLHFTFEDGTELDENIPAQVWRFNQKEVKKVFYFEKKLKSIEIDKYQETSDINIENNSWPQKSSKSRFEVFKQTIRPYSNEMQDAANN